MNNKTDYWLETADDDVLTAKAMFEAKRFLWMGFICHLVVEKALKAVIAINTDDMPPKIHDLRRLAALGGIIDELSSSQRSLLGKLMPLHIEARYPEYKQAITETLTKDYSEQVLIETEDFLCWIKQRLGK